MHHPMSDRPNLLLVIHDHVAWHGHYGERGGCSYRWPAYERLRRDGCEFSQGRCIQPLCTPARSSILTGLRPARHGLMFNCERPGFNDLKPGTALFTEHLRSAGYRCAYVGKWHCGRQRIARDHGLEGWSLPDYGHVYRSAEYQAYAQPRGLRPLARIEHQVDHQDWVGSVRDLAADERALTSMDSSGVLLGPPEAHEATFLGHEGVRWLQHLGAGPQPWCLVLSLWSPHQPFFPSEPFASAIAPESIPEHPSFRDDLRGRPSRHRLMSDLQHPGRQAWKGEWATYQRILGRAYGQGLQADAAVGQVLDALDASGQAGNTLVAVTADHGDALACHGGQWNKTSVFYEELARIPLALRWPGHIAAGASPALVSNLDLPATLLEAAGVAVPDTWDSRSLLPLCAGDPGREELVLEHTLDERVPQRVLYHGRWKYVAALFDGHELYDLAADPWELHNLAEDPAHLAVREDLAARLLRQLEGSQMHGEKYLAHALRLGYR